MPRSRGYKTWLTGALVVVLRLVGPPVRIVYRVLFSPLDDLLEERRRAAFAEQLKVIYGALLKEHQGTVAVEERRIRAVDYLSAELLFPDRMIQITRGRNEVRVLVDALEVYTSFEEEYGGALRRSAVCIARHWDELPSATAPEVRRWSEQEI